MNGAINQPIRTPIGDGITQGQYTIQDRHGEPVVRAVLVRLPINDATRKELHKSNCLTPRAVMSGLWVFGEESLE